MDHAQFKAKQTAAAYVADGLDERTLEDFETHMMDCRECVEDVESWRAIKVNMPRPAARPGRAPAVPARNAQPWLGWRMAASLLMTGTLGLAGGWFGHESQTPNLDSTQTTFFNVLATQRGGGDCERLRLAPETKFAVLRVPGVTRDRKVIAADADKRELPATHYTSRIQPDGSQLVRIDAQMLNGRDVFLEAHGAEGFGEPLGCVTGEVTSGR